MNRKITGLVGAIAVLLSLLIMVGLYVASFVGVHENSPVVIYYGSEEIGGVHNMLPLTSLRNSMASCGFELDLIEPDASSVPEGELGYYVPGKYTDRDVVVIASGDMAIPAMNELSDTPNVVGFVLINPVNDGNFSMEALSQQNPASRVAIFVADGVTDVAVRDARNIYERLSGEDALYGISISDDSLFGATTYINPADTRQLSILPGGIFGGGSIGIGSSEEISRGMLFNVGFQAQLASYLGAFFEEYNSARFASWNILLVIAMMLFAFGVPFFLLNKKRISFLPSLSKAASSLNQSYSEKRQLFQTKADRRNKVATVVTGILAVLVVVFTFVSIFVGEISFMVPVLLCALPCVFYLVLAMPDFLFYIGNRRSYKIKSKAKSLQMLIILVPAIFVLLALMNIVGLFSYEMSGIQVVLALLLALLDFVSISVITSSEIIRITRSQQVYKPASSNIKFYIVMLPAVFAILMGLITRFEIAVIGGMCAIILYVVPMLFAVVQKRHTGSPLATGLTHGLLYFVLLLAFL